MEKSVRVCDLDDQLATETIEVVVNGTSRVLDVCEDHLAWAKTLPRQRAESSAPKPSGGDSKQPATRAKAGRDGKAGKPSGSPRSGRQPGSRRAMQLERAAVREWARAHGRDVGERGRLPAGLLEEYKAAEAAG